jgi:hypothetical protein
MGLPKKWFKNHESANFFWIIILISVILLAIGLLLSKLDNPIMSFISNFVIQLSGAALATAILTVFLSFGDVKKSLTSTLSNLWIEGKVVDSLSNSVKSKIDKRIILSNSSDIKEINESLFIDLTKLRDKCLNSFHIINYNYEIVLSDWEKNSEFIIHRVKCTYRVISSHIAIKEKKYPLKFYYEITIPNDLELIEKDFIRNFNIKIDKQEFDKNDVTISKAKIGTMQSISISISKEIEIKDYADVLLDVETLSCKKINDEMLIARYPTLGYKVTMRYTDKYDYDCCWFRANCHTDIYKLNEAQQSIYNDGITAITNDWVLPGDGATLCWYKK